MMLEKKDPKARPHSDILPSSRPHLLILPLALGTFSFKPPYIHSTRELAGAGDLLLELCVAACDDLDTEYKNISGRVFLDF